MESADYRNPGWRARKKCQHDRWSKPAEISLFFSAVGKEWSTILPIGLFEDHGVQRITIKDISMER
jgi:hypothetical protein